MHLADRVLEYIHAGRQETNPLTSERGTYHKVNQDKRHLLTYNLADSVMNIQYNCVRMGLYGMCADLPARVET